MHVHSFHSLVWTAEDTYHQSTSNLWSVCEGRSPQKYIMPVRKTCLLGMK